MPDNDKTNTTSVSLGSVNPGGAEGASTEAKPVRGRLKLFLGFAAGVGKTYSMLGEANRRVVESGQDVVVGFVETHGRNQTASQVGSLEVIPRKKIEYRGATFEEMDTEAIIKRHPKWVVVDELAHTNVPGSKHEKRFRDVLEILAAGINVLSAMNIQHLESLNDSVMQITGIKVRETVPDWILGRADEIVSVDITPRALINRLERGDVYNMEKVPQALSNFFREGNLSALREMALREIASAVDRSVQTYRAEQGIAEPWRIQERVMICISPDHPSDKLLRRGWRVAQRLQGEVVAVYVSSCKLQAGQQKILDADFALATQLNIPVEQVEGHDIARALADYALKNQITEMVIGHSKRTWQQQLLKPSLVNKLISLVPSTDVLVIAERTDKKGHA
ncbi:MAG TPA: universal stress protein [Capsulimonadaceae bacterium]|jgi:two-component system sensor histidine kinase KdpD